MLDYDGISPNKSYGTSFYQSHIKDQLESIHFGGTQSSCCTLGNEGDSVFQCDSSRMNMYNYY